MQPSRTCTRRSLPIPINMVHLRGAWKGRGDFDRMNRDQWIDIFWGGESDERFFHSLCADWMRTRVINRWTGELREWRDRPNLKWVLPPLMANLDWLTLGTDSEKEEAWHEIGGGIISDSELLDSMDGGRALQLKHEINVESTIIQRGTTKRDRDQPLYIGFQTCASSNIPSQ